MVLHQKHGASSGDPEDPRHGKPAAVDLYPANLTLL